MPQTSKTLLFFIVLLFFTRMQFVLTTKRLSCRLYDCFSFMSSIRQNILRIVVISATFHSLNNLKSNFRMQDNKKSTW